MQKLRPSMNGQGIQRHGNNRFAAMRDAMQNAMFTLQYSERIYLLERGSFAMEGTPEELRKEDYIRETYFGA